MTDAALPEGPLVAFYGDDFTGASAVMEVMTFAGLPCILFVGEPTADQIAACKDYRGIGIAGTARAQSPEWMQVNLPPAFAALSRTGAPLVHYKVCSTFDSSPHTGSIGKALDIGTAVFPACHTPVVVGAPAMGRYQCFGNLFAAVDGRVHRLDRHPVMARHPVTPMAEADLRLHLAAQTERSIGLIDLAALHRGAGAEVLASQQGPHNPAVFIDVADAESLAGAGALLWQNRSAARFVAGSQGVEYALVAHWRAEGLLTPAAAPSRAKTLAQIAAVSGSCSPVTARQIQAAEHQRFDVIRLDAACVTDAQRWRDALDRAVVLALEAVQRGASPLIFTALGPEDPALVAVAAAADRAGWPMARTQQALGRGLGAILANVLRQSRLRRAVIAGGDTSGEALADIGVYALSALAPLVAGAPLCLARSADSSFDGLELCLKGGQMGGIDFFAEARAGGPL